MRGMGIVPVDLIRRVQAANAPGVTIPEVLDSNEMAFMGTVWNDARNYADFNGIPWAALGYGNGIPLSPAAKVALGYVWSQIRVAARWTDPRWDFHRIPANLIASALPPPEVEPAAPVQTAAPAPAATPAPSAPTFNLSTPASSGSSPMPYFSTEPIPDDATESPAPGPVKAGLFSGSLPSWVLPLVGLALAMPIILPGKFGGGSRRRRRR